MHQKPPPNYLAGYPVAQAEQVQRLIEQDRLADMLRHKYPLAHAVRTDKALYDYVLELKGTLSAQRGAAEQGGVRQQAACHQQRTGYAHPHLAGAGFKPDD